MNLTIERTKKSFEFFIKLSNLEFTSTKFEDSLILTARQRRLMKMNFSPTSKLKNENFANDMMKTSFQKSDFYLKTIIKIDEQIRSRRFLYDCSMIENEIFQKKMTMYFLKKRSSKSTK